MDCKRKKLRRESDKIVFSIIHDIKRIAPLMAIFIKTEPKPFADVQDAHAKIMAILDTVMEREIEILRENRHE